MVDPMARRHPHMRGRVGARDVGCVISEGGAPALDPTTIGAGADIWIDPNDFALGDIDSVPGKGTAGLTWEIDTVGEEPEIIAVGGAKGLQFDGSTEGLFADSTFQLAKEYVVSLVARIDTFASNDIPIAFDGGSPPTYLITRSSGELRWEETGSNLDTSGFSSSTAMFSMTVHVVGSGTDSEIYIDGASSGTVTGTATAPADVEVSLGWLQTKGFGCACTILDVAVWSGDSSVDLADVHTWQAAVKAAAA